MIQQINFAKREAFEGSSIQQTANQMNEEAIVSHR